MTSTPINVPSGNAAPTLDDVRTRFLAAEDILSRTAGTLAELRGAIESVEDARQGVGSAAEALRQLHEPLTTGVELLRSGAARLEEGVSQLRDSEPGALLRRLDAMEASLHSAQGATSERIQLMERRADARAEDQADRLQRLDGGLQGKVDTLGLAVEKAVVTGESLAPSLDRIEDGLSTTKEAVAELRSEAASQLEAVRERVAETLSQGVDAIDRQSSARSARLSTLLGEVQNGSRRENQQLHAKMAEWRAEGATQLEDIRERVVESLTESMGEVDGRSSARNTVLTTLLREVQDEWQEQGRQLRANESNLSDLKETLQASIAASRTSLQRMVIATAFGSVVAVALVVLAIGT